ncbi:MAG: VTT domain-containing protein [Campylobacter sp.]|nr:VTT domain-containing protein [Campylobacter sp.]
MKNERIWLKLITLIAILIGAILVYLNSEILQNFITQKSKIAWMIYILAWIVLPIFFFPVPVLAGVGGVLFGLVWGSVFTLVGAMINMLIMFYLGKVFKTKSIKFRINDKFSYILVLRLIPFIPYNLLNYACGFFNISLRNYIPASLIGIIPGTLVLINLGDKALKFGTSEFWWSVFWFVLLCVVSVCIKRLIR